MDGWAELQRIEADIEHLDRRRLQLVEQRARLELVLAAGDDTIDDEQAQLLGLASKIQKSFAILKDL